MTKAIPGAGGIAWNKFSNARRPPAEAPMPTIGNGAAFLSGLIANLVAHFRGRLVKLIHARQFCNVANSRCVFSFTRSPKTLAIPAHAGDIGADQRLVPDEA